MLALNLQGTNLSDSDIMADFDAADALMGMKKGIWEYKNSTEVRMVFLYCSYTEGPDTEAPGVGAKVVMVI